MSRCNQNKRTATQDIVVSFALTIICISIFCGYIIGCSSNEETQSLIVKDEIQIGINPTIELFSLIHRYVGDNQYTEVLLPDYLKEIENHFGHLKDHQTIKFAKNCSLKYQINGDAPMSLAVYIGPPPALEPKIDLTNLPEDFDPRWNTALVLDYLENARVFAIESNFMNFFKEHSNFHELSIANLQTIIDKEHLLLWYYNFFGYYPDNFHIYIALLNGSCSYGYPLTLQDDHMEFVSVIGARWPDSNGAPTYNQEWFLPLIIHEFCHSYINPLTISKPEVFKELGEALLVSHRDRMVEHGYNVWNVILNEYMVRACTIRFLEHTKGRLAARRNVKYDKSRGFYAIEGLVKLLEEYENNRNTYPDIESFLPQIKRYLESYTGEL